MHLSCLRKCNFEPLASISCFGGAGGGDGDVGQQENVVKEAV